MNFNHRPMKLLITTQKTINTQKNTCTMNDDTKNNQQPREYTCTNEIIHCTTDYFTMRLAHYIQISTTVNEHI